MTDTLKGEFAGTCNRTACQKPNAVWYNRSTRAYYCAGCAHRINYAAADLAEPGDMPPCIPPHYLEHPHSSPDLSRDGAGSEP